MPRRYPKKKTYKKKSAYRKKRMYKKKGKTNIKSALMNNTLFVKLKA